MIVDSHCHLYDLRNDLDGVLARSKEAGVSTILNIGASVLDFEGVNLISSQNENVYSSFGIHPYHVNEIALSEIKDILNHWSDMPRVVAIGECGLDFVNTEIGESDQITAFEKHAEIAIEKNIPIIVHMRQTEKLTLDVLRSHAGLNGVIHCFTSDMAFAESAIELGFYISFSGIITFKNAETIREVAKSIPSDKILIETDAPFLAPVPFRGKTNEPSLLPYVLQCVAQLRGLSIKEMSEITTNNFFRLFNKCVKN